MNITWRDFQFVFISAPIFILVVLIPSSIMGLVAVTVLSLYTFFAPKKGLLILLIYFPLRPFLIEVSPSLKMIGDCIILAAFAHILWKQMRKREWRSLFQFHIFEWSFFLFAGVGTVSAILTGVSLGAILFQLRAFFITYLLFYIVRRLNVKKKDVLKFLWTTFFIALLLSLHGVIEKISLRTLLLPDAWVLRSLSPNNRVRIYGLTNNPNVLAMYLSIAVMLTIYLKTFVHKNFHWILNIGVIFMMGVITLTYSRGTWIGFVIGSLVYFLFTRDWKLAGKIVSGVIVAVIFIHIPVTASANYSRAHNLFFERTVPLLESNVEDSHEVRRLKETFDMSTIELSRTTGRLFIVRKGLEIFKDHQVIGTGFATYGDSAAKSHLSPIYERYGIESSIYTDNQYIQIIAQTGAVGVILFAVFLLGMLFFLWGKRKEASMVLPVFSLLIAVFVCGLLYNIWEDKVFTTYFYIMLAVVGREVSKEGIF